MNDVTKMWVRNRADELAVDDGCWFDPAIGGYAVWWIERHCVLYEGEYAGEPLRLRGCHEDDIHAWDIPEAFDAEHAIARAQKYAEQFASGAQCDWQYECLMRLFGWQRHSTRWGRAIRRFRKGSIWVSKKNKKSPTLAAVGLYLLCGDGEQGQKVFFGAKDGSQARDIMGEHVKAMYQQSPALESECDLNLNKMRITHRASRSFMQPMSSSNARTKESKEGLNGCVLIDETHVVDRDFIRRIKRAGISRAEPLQLELSTAGTNPDGYGKEQFDYGARVNSGDVLDIGMFYAAYAAPQDSADDDIKANPIQFGRLSNPAWGHTISDDEFLADFSSSQVNEQEWRDFKMYRLNIWQSSVNPWLPAGAWEKCRKSYTEDDLLGELAIGGLDLSRTRDFSAFTLLFPTWGENGMERARLLSWIFATEEYVDAHKLDAKFLDYQRALRGSKRGEFIVTPGSRIDIGRIYQTIAQCSRRFRISAIGYDPYNGEALTQLIEQGALDSEGRFLTDGLEIPRYEVNQHGWTMGTAADEFAAMCAAGTMEHCGHELFDWMMGNVNIKVTNGRTRMVKPDRVQVRKIDGPISAVIALATAMGAEREEVNTLALHVMSAPVSTRQEPVYDDDTEDDDGW